MRRGVQLADRSDGKDRLADQTEYRGRLRPVVAVEPANTEQNFLRRIMSWQPGLSELALHYVRGVSADKRPAR